jgi:prepilin-type N-terminal cleavage/methylation domain-containing protein
MSTFPGSGHHYLVDTGGWSAFEVNARPLDWSNLAFLRPTFANASHAQYYRMPRRHAFTLLEILIAIVIGLMLLLIAVPSVSGMIREQKLRETFQKFDNYVRAAQTRAMRERRTYVMVWDKKGIDLVPLDPTVPDAART